MKFFIDTGDVAEIREAQAQGIIDGVTTNPSLVAKTGRKFRDVLTEICEVVKGPVSAEVVARCGGRGSPGAPICSRQVSSGPVAAVDGGKGGQRAQRAAIL